MTMTVLQIFQKAMADYERGSLDSAESLARHLIKAKADFDGGHYLCALIALRRGEGRAAAKFLSRALAISPTQPVLHTAMARAQMMQNRYPSAIDHYRQALDIRNDDADLWCCYANALRHGGRYDDAEQAYRRADSLSPDHLEIKNDLAGFLIERGRAEEAVPLLEQALRLRPDWPVALGNLASALKSLGRLREAVDLFGRLLILSPQDGAIHSDLALLYLSLGDLTAAGGHARQAVALAPDHPSAWLALALSLWKSQDPVGALAALQKLLILYPAHAHAHAHVILGDILRGMDRIEEAVQAYRHALALDPEDRLGAGLALAALGAAVIPKQASPSYVASLFNQYAERFDQDLRGNLDYRGPELIFQAINALPSADLFEILDIGCGTGLAAPLLKPIAKRLDGVDLSMGMIEKARARHLYDDLSVGDMAAVMTSRPNAYDLIVAVDVLVYIGDLDEIFASARLALRRGGRFVFSVEKKSQGGSLGYGLTEKSRYAHTADYIRACAERHFFTISTLREEWTRKEGGHPVEGLIVVAS